MTELPPETPDHHGAYPRLEKTQLQTLAASGERRPTREGDVLFREGDEQLRLLRRARGQGRDHRRLGPDDEQVIAVHGPRPLPRRARPAHRPAASFDRDGASRPGEVLAVPVERAARAWSPSDPALGDLILRAFLAAARAPDRRSAPACSVVGSRYSPDTRRLREFARPQPACRTAGSTSRRTRRPRRCCGELGVTPEETPVVIWRGAGAAQPEQRRAGARARPARARAGRRRSATWSSSAPGPPGSPPRSTARRRASTPSTLDAVADGRPGGHVVADRELPRLPRRASPAPSWPSAPRVQAEKFGARAQRPGRGRRARARDEGHHVVELDDGSTVAARTVVIATGARYRRLAVAAAGASSRARASTTPRPPWRRSMCAGDPVAVVGGGNSAGQAALFLAPARRGRAPDRPRGRPRREHVALPGRPDRAQPAIEVLLHTEVRELDRRRGARGPDRRGQRDRRARASSTPGHCSSSSAPIPHTSWLGDELALDDERLRPHRPDVEAAWDGDGREPLPLETSRPGVFAVGRRARRLDQARGLGRGRGLDGGLAGPRAPRGTAWRAGGGADHRGASALQTKVSST